MKNIFLIKIFRWFLIIGFVVFLSFTIYYLKNISQINSDIQNIQISNVKYVKIGGVKVKVDLALTPSTQEQGLSGRTELKEDEGILFVFTHMGKYSFWMKDMNFPIDIIWLAPYESIDFKDLRVVHIEKNVDPDSYPKTFVSEQDAKYVLEVISSFSQKNNLKLGDKVEFLSS